MEYFCGSPWACVQGMGNVATPERGDALGYYWRWGSGIRDLNVETPLNQTLQIITRGSYSTGGWGERSDFYGEARSFLLGRKEVCQRIP